MSPESAHFLKPSPLAASPVSEADYRHWIHRFDLLWSSVPSVHVQHEMQALLLLIEQYETASRLFTAAHHQGETS